MQSAVTAMHDVVHAAGRVSIPPRTEPLRVSKSSSNSKRANSNELLSSEPLRATSEPPMLDEPLLEQCLGCPTMECVKQWRSFRDLPQDVPAWMLHHDFFEEPSCVEHQQANMVRRGLHGECRVRTGDTTCRQRVHIHAPFLRTSSSCFGATSPTMKALHLSKRISASIRTQSRSYSTALEQRVFWPTQWSQPVSRIAPSTKPTLEAQTWLLVCNFD